MSLGIIVRIAQATCIVVATSIASSAVAQTNGAANDPRVQSLVKTIPLADKIDLLAGAGLFTTHALPAFGIPAFLLTDGPMGARLPPPSTAYAAGIGLAATWDADLAHEVGVQLGRDARSRGSAFLLGPGMNMYRAPMNGRNFEYFGEDPYLASRIAVGYIEGVQSQNVSAVAKHLAGNNSEYARTTSDSIIDEHALRELYLPAFEAAVKEARVASVMGSYNLVNGSYATQNASLNIDVLRRDWGFDGLLMSDWGATHDALAAANGGLDLEMPGGTYMNRKNLLPEIQAGTLKSSTIDGKITHLLGVAQRFGWLDKPMTDSSIPRYNLAGDAVALRGTEEGMVLLKNAGNLLPLQVERLKRVAVIGPLAYPGAPTGGGSGDVPTFAQTSPLTGLAEALRGQAEVTWSRGVPPLSLLSGVTALHPAPGSPMQGVLVEVFDNPKLEGKPIDKRAEFAISYGDALDAQALSKLFNNYSLMQVLTKFGQRDKNYSRWTGYLDVKTPQTYTFFVENSGSYRLLLDGKVLVDQSSLHRTSLWQEQITVSAGMHKMEYEALPGLDQNPTFYRAGAVPSTGLVEEDAVELAKQADVVVLSLGYGPEIESENMDRSFELPVGQDELVRRILAVNPRVIVTMTSGGSVDVSAWIDQVPAFLETWYPGQQGGKALAEVLLGRKNPSGHLPISWERKLTDNPSYENYYYNDPQHPKDIVYREGVFTGYRGYDHTGVQPLFPFGFGLSYTQFAFDELAAASPKNGAVQVSFTVHNKGRIAGVAVPQIYLAPPQGTLPDEPEKTLVAFVRTEVGAGQSKRVVLDIPLRAFTHFDGTKKQWVAAAGTYTLLLGESSARMANSAKTRLATEVALPLSAPVAASTVVMLR